MNILQKHGQQAVQTGILLAPLLLFMVDQDEQGPHDTSRPSSVDMHLTAAEIRAAVARRTPAAFSGLSLDTVFCRDMLIMYENSKSFRVNCYAKDMHGNDIDITERALRAVQSMHQ